MTGRADLYAAYARLLLPREGDQAPQELIRVLPDGAELESVLPASLPEEHLRAFGPTLCTESPPYESSYGTSHVFMQSQLLADIAGFYRAFGLNPPSEERPDHLAVELEFMQFLAAKEAHAVQDGAAEPAKICAEAQRSFLSEHLGRWVPAFAARFRERNSSPFYDRLIAQIEEFVRKDCAGCDVRPAPVSAAELKIPEPDTESACGSCPVSEFQ